MGNKDGTVITTPPVTTDERQETTLNFDVESNLSTVQRSVSSLKKYGQPARAVTISRIFATTTDDLWDAVTNSERISRWFLPVSGELQLGGRYQLEGNAGGEITACEPRSHFALTWEFGDDVSWVEVSLADEGADRTRLTLTHTQILSEHWSEYGPGATGIGWELGLLSLDFHIAQPAAPKPDEAAFAASPDGKAIIAGSSEGWSQAAIAAGADPDAAHAAARRTTVFYTGEPALRTTARQEAPCDTIQSGTPCHASE